MSVDHLELHVLSHSVPTRRFSDLRAGKRDRLRWPCSKADVTPPKSARLLLHVRFFDPDPDAPLPEASAFGLRPATPPSAQNSFPHSSAHDHRGSGTEDFLTPGGV